MLEGGVNMCCELRGVSIYVWGGGGGFNMSGGGGINMPSRATCLGGGGGRGATCLAEGLLQQYNVTLQSYTLKTTLSK